MHRKPAGSRNCVETVGTGAEPSCTEHPTAGKGIGNQNRWIFGPTHGISENAGRAEPKKSRSSGRFSSSSSSHSHSVTHSHSKDSSFMINEHRNKPTRTMKEPSQDTPTPAQTEDGSSNVPSQSTHGVEAQYTLGFGAQSTPPEVTTIADDENKDKSKVTSEV
ncbi:hypothetical protein C5167_008581 [Papaver somniferum]|uniref:Uncharacterized protein n=1 Tax=Papaver somniferum TaxID=3469 RepID=A0A4Y7JXX6_PAPSO|nr:hypothetical protein C5167_008581 [Papaver somniferum]